ncbi:MAG: MAE_28990/MAE_18760 family HEPN-like nuclease [Cyanobacteria bacterium P01_G01_bin.54]
MNDFSQSFEERLQEIEEYLDFLEALEQQVQSGTPQLGENGATITVKQQRILYSSVYLQLYNLIESTISRCLQAVSEGIIEEGVRPDQLSEDLRREWVRFVARTHTELNYENRLRSVLVLCEHLIQELPISTFEISKGAGGNWDYGLINSLGERLGFSLSVSRGTYQNIRRRIRDDKGVLELVKGFRNDLAHGSISFAECGEGVTVSELRDFTNRTSAYLREIIDCFKSSLENCQFLRPEHRPNNQENEIVSEQSP